MNIPFAAAALLLAVAFFAHLFVGTRETLSLKPDEENSTQQGTRNWMQAVCAFQLVSIDLLLLATTACLLAFTRGFRRYGSRRRPFCCRLSGPMVRRVADTA